MVGMVGKFWVLIVFGVFVSVAGMAQSVTCAGLFGDSRLQEKIFKKGDAELFRAYRNYKIRSEDAVSTPKLFSLMLQLQIKRKAMPSKTRSQMDDLWMISRDIEEYLEKLTKRTWTEAELSWLRFEFSNVERLFKMIYGKPELFVRSQPSREVLLWDVFLDKIYFAIRPELVESFEGTHSLDSFPKEARTMWWQLKLNALNTSYSLIRTIFQHPKLAGISSVADMGSGLGHFGLYAGSSYPKMKFVGYEYFQHRTEGAQQAAASRGYKNTRFIQADFVAASTKIEIADAYIVYYSNSDRGVLKSLFEKIAAANNNRKYLVVAIGVRDMNELAPWLQQVVKSPRYGSYPDDHDFVIYEPK